MFTLFWIMGLLAASRDSAFGSWFRKQPDPIFGFELRELIKRGNVELKPRVTAYGEDGIRFEDHSELNVPNVIWSTGFRPNYPWILIEGVLDDKGLPLHRRGVSPIDGLYFVGLPWQHSRASALIGGVGEDAEYVVASLE